jgi:hypothetical protein
MSRYSINNNIESDPNPFTTLGAFPLFGRGQNATIGLTHVFNPRIAGQRDLREAVNGRGVIETLNTSGLIEIGAAERGSEEEVTAVIRYARVIHPAVQDSFRLTPNITINAGVPFEYKGFYNGIRGQKTGFNLTTGKLVIPSSIDPAVQPLTATLTPLFADRINYTKALGLPEGIQAGQPDFAPRFGIAWRPKGTDKMVVRAGYGIFYLFPDGGNINNWVATVPFIAATTIFNDRPPLKPTRTYSALSCELSSSTSVDVAYVGNKSTQLQTQPSINDPLPGPGSIQGRRPYPQWGTIGYGTFDGYASYHALQSKFESRNYHGLTTLVTYTYSKCIDIGGGVTQYYQRNNRAVCDFNLPSVSSASFDYLLPVGKGHRFLTNAPAAINQVLGDWELAGVMTARSGLPFTPTINGDVANTGVSGQRPQVVGTPLIVGTPTCWFYISANPACAGQAPGATNAFAAPATYTYGNSGRNILQADKLIQFDLTVMKNFHFDEKRSMEFRAEMFNILNHPAFASPTGSQTPLLKKTIDLWQFPEEHCLERLPLPLRRKLRPMPPPP